MRPSYVYRRRAVLGTGSARLPRPHWQNSVFSPSGLPAGPAFGRARRGHASGTLRPDCATGAAYAGVRAGPTCMPHFGSNLAMSTGLIFALVCAVAALVVRRCLDQLDPRQARRQRSHAGDRRGDPDRARRPTSTASTPRSASSASSCSSSSGVASAGRRPSASASARSSPGSRATSG